MRKFYIIWSLVSFLVGLAVVVLLKFFFTGHEMSNKVVIFWGSVTFVFLMMTCFRYINVINCVIGFLAIIYSFIFFYIHGVLDIHGRYLGDVRYLGEGALLFTIGLIAMVGSIVGSFFISPESFRSSKFGGGGSSYGSYYDDHRPVYDNSKHDEEMDELDRFKHE